MITLLPIKIKRLLCVILASMLSALMGHTTTLAAENPKPDLLFITDFNTEIGAELGAELNSALNSGESSEPILAISATQKTDPLKLALGQKLFHEKRLDKNKKLACASCHNLRLGGANRQALSPQSTHHTTHQPPKFNTPSIFNVSLNAYYYWSGKFSSLEEQLDDALIDINSTWPYAIKQLSTIPEYRTAFNQVYPDGITTETIKDAIIYFEESLTTPDAPFDQYLRGNAGAISLDEKHGYQLFKTYGCITCHQGVNIGGNFLLNRKKQIDKAYYNLHNKPAAGTESELPYIRVPSLRNVARTAPYFHDGSARTLDQAVNQMLKQYLGAEVPSDDIRLIVSFLNTLTGEYKGQSL